MGKWAFRFLLFASFFVAGYVLYSILEIDSGVRVSARNESDGRLHKTPDNMSFGIKKLRLPIESLKNKQVSVYYVPHPDDEILTYGVPIRNDLHAGKIVYLVLFTHGEGSAILLKLNKMIKPEKLTPKKLGLARVKEFIHSSRSLGIDDNHKDVYDPKDRKYKIALIKRLALYFESIFPHVTHNGMSRFDTLQEHALTGQVLGQLYNEGKIKHKNTYASLFMSRFAKKRLTGKLIRLSHHKDEVFLNNSILDYSRWDPKHGWYACGYLSVQEQFKHFSAQKYSILTKE